MEALLFRLQADIARPQTWTTQGAVRPGWSDAQGDKSDSDLRERVGGNNMANLKKGRSTHGRAPGGCRSPNSGPYGPFAASYQ